MSPAYIDHSCQISQVCTRMVFRPVFSSSLEPRVQHRVRIETESDRWRTVTGMWETSTDTSVTLIPK